MSKILSWIFLIILGFISLCFIIGVVPQFIFILIFPKNIWSLNPEYAIGVCIGTFGFGFLLYLGIKKLINSIRRKEK